MIQYHRLPLVYVHWSMVGFCTSNCIWVDRLERVGFLLGFDLRKSTRSICSVHRLCLLFSYPKHGRRVQVWPWWIRKWYYLTQEINAGWNAGMFKSTFSDSSTTSCMFLTSFNYISTRVNQMVWNNFRICFGLLNRFNNFDAELLRTSDSSGVRRSRIITSVLDICIGRCQTTVPAHFVTASQNFPISEFFKSPTDTFRQVRMLTSTTCNIPHN